MEDAIGEERDPRNLTLRILEVNFAAIHTTSMVSLFFRTYLARVNFPVKTFTFALYQLLAQ
jgi:hypothetical protein